MRKCEKVGFNLAISDAETRFLGPTPFLKMDDFLRKMIQKSRFGGSLLIWKWMISGEKSRLGAHFLFENERFLTPSYAETRFWEPLATFRSSISDVNWPFQMQKRDSTRASPTQTRNFRCRHAIWSAHSHFQMLERFARAQWRVFFLGLKDPPRCSSIWMNSPIFSNHIMLKIVVY